MLKINHGMCLFRRRKYNTSILMIRNDFGQWQFVRKPKTCNANRKLLSYLQRTIVYIVLLLGCNIFRRLTDFMWNGGTRHWYNRNWSQFDKATKRRRDGRRIQRFSSGAFRHHDFSPTLRHQSVFKQSIHNFRGGREPQPLALVLDWPRVRNNPASRCNLHGEGHRKKTMDNPSISVE